MSKNMGKEQFFHALHSLKILNLLNLAQKSLFCPVAPTGHSEEYSPMVSGCIYCQHENCANFWLLLLCIGRRAAISNCQNNHFFIEFHLSLLGLDFYTFQFYVLYLHCCGASEHPKTRASICRNDRK